MSEPLTLPTDAVLNGPPAPTRDDDILRVLPPLDEVCKDLMWAEIQYAAGAFQAQSGKLIGIVNKTVLTAGYDPGAVRNDAARLAGVIPARVALFHVDDGGSW